MELPESLAASGKSRADLWSFASAVAVEWGLERNNMVGRIVWQGGEIGLIWTLQFNWGLRLKTYLPTK